MGKRKWWLHNDMKKDFGIEPIEGDENGAYVCTITGDQMPYDHSEDSYFLKNKTDAYRFVCEYLTKFFKQWNKNAIDKKDLKDWTHLYWRLNYGSGDGPTKYELTIRPMTYEYDNE